ncbi:uncharacterized protein LOC134206090 [Armigeres subalbatus]|uniref:uncharacterized protein LOC134206090 n=1 Tax=Armigeres subalbatus TaxID=124917 RepID=UPI002ED565A0
MLTNMSYMVAPNIEPYRKGQSFASWIKRLSCHFRVNKVKENEKKYQMLLLGGDFLFNMADKLFPTDELLEELSYEVVVQKLKERLDNNDSVLLHRYNFSRMVQQPGESAGDYIFSLKVLAENCEFGDQKDYLILDRILVGLQDGSLHHRLLTENNLTLEQAERIIASWEMATYHTKMLANNNVDSVASINTKHPFCYLDNKDYKHNSQLDFQQFRYRDESASTSHSRRKIDGNQRMVDQRICDYCGQRGHVRRRCFNIKREKSDEVKHVDIRKTGVIPDSLSHQLDSLKTMDCGSDNNKENDLELECMRISSIDYSSNSCLLDVSVERNVIRMQIDSGSPVTVMGTNLFNSKLNLPLCRMSNQLTVMNDSTQNKSGEIEVAVELDGG